MKQPTSAGENPIIMCQPMVMTFRWPPYADVTSTTGPGSRNRRTFVTGKFFFLYFRIRPNLSGFAGSNCKGTSAITRPVSCPHRHVATAARRDCKWPTPGRRASPNSVKLWAIGGKYDGLFGLAVGAFKEPHVRDAALRLGLDLGDNRVDRRLRETHLRPHLGDTRIL